MLEKNFSAETSPLTGRFQIVSLCLSSAMATVRARRLAHLLTRTMFLYPNRSKSKDLQLSGKTIHFKYMSSKNIL